MVNGLTHFAEFGRQFHDRVLESFITFLTAYLALSLDDIYRICIRRLDEKSIRSLGYIAKYTRVQAVDVIKDTIYKTCLLDSNLCFVTCSIAYNPRWQLK